MMKKIIIITMLLVVSMSPSFALPVNALKPDGKGIRLNIVSRNKSYYTILLPAKSTPQDNAAAQILSSTIQKISGVILPIVNESNSTIKGPFFSIGQTKAAKFLSPEPDMKQDGYRIVIKDGNCFLQGGEQRGAVNAVLAFLEEDLGCRWYSIFNPSTLPKGNELSVEVVPRSYQPPLEVRSVYISEAWEPNWIIMNRAAPMVPRVKLDPAFGWNRSYPSGGWFAHTFSRLAPPAELLKKHPEYFALIKGHRDTKNICLTNPEVVKIVSKNVNHILDQNPDSRIFSISQNDGGNVFCRCEKCKKLSEFEGSDSGLLLNFVNQVAKGVRVKHPEVKISTLAYLTSYNPPKTIKPGSNVVIFLATDRHMWQNPFHYIDETSEFQNALAGWNRISKEIHIWDYTFGDNANWMNPSPNFDVLAHNLRFFVKHKTVSGVFFQDNFLSVGDSRGTMKTWILTKLLWNPDWNVKELEKDFTLGYYGAAGPAMQKYNDLLRHEWVTYHNNNRPGTKKFTVSSTFLTEAKRIVLEAKRAVANNKLLTKEVEREEVCLLYQRLEKGPVNSKDIKPFFADIKKMQSMCKELGITSFSETSSFNDRFRDWKLSALSAREPLPTPGTIRLGINRVILPSSCGLANASVINEPTAPTSMAIYQPCSITHWSVQWRVTPASFLAAKGKYMVRIRVKSGPLKEKTGEVFHFGLYSEQTQLVFQRNYKVSELSQKKYIWLEAAVIDTPRNNMTFFAGPVKNSAAKYIYIDSMELIPELEYQKLKK